MSTKAKLYEGLSKALVNHAKAQENLWRNHSVAQQSAQIMRAVADVLSHLADAALSHPTAADPADHLFAAFGDGPGDDQCADLWCRYPSLRDWHKRTFAAAKQPQASEQGAGEVIYVDPSMLREVLAGNQRFVAMNTSPDKWATKPVTLSVTPPAPKLERISRDGLKVLMSGAGYVCAGAQEKADFINGFRHAEAHYGISTKAGKGGV
jgi:hypothetical protein